MKTSATLVFALLALALSAQGFEIRLNFDPSDLEVVEKQDDQVLEIQPYNEPFVRCIDDVLDWPRDWTKSSNDVIYSPEDVSLPNPFDRSGLNATGLWYFRETGNDDIQWPKYNLAPGNTEYFYARYLSYRTVQYTYPDHFERILPAVNASIFMPSEKIEWQEACFVLDHYSSAKRLIQKTSLGRGDIFILDKMAYLSLPPDRTIRCGRTEFQDILEYCNNFLPDPPASTPSPPTETTPEVPPPPHEETQHWIDVQQDLQRLQWTSVGSSLRYSDCSEPTFEGASTSARGIFVLEGREDEDAQEIVSTRLNGGQSYLYIRYYVNHVSSNETLVQKYYVMPAADQVMGVRYLDSTPDSRWKEAFVHLDSAEPFVVRVGTSSKDPRDRLLIDKIVLNQRHDGGESSCQADGLDFQVRD